MSHPAPDGPIPEEQQPGHQPAQDADKPDLDAFAERLGVVPEGDEPAGAPSVMSSGPSSTTLERIRNRQQALLVGGAAIVAVAAILTIRRLRRR